MAKTWKCEDQVSFELFQKDRECTVESVTEKLQYLLEKYPQKKIYIGVSQHPCGRFKQDYDSLIFSPELNLREFEYEIKPELLEEEAHEKEYEKMYVICFRRSTELIFTIERRAIEFIKLVDINNNILANIGPGGNGNLGKSEFYFLYACISKSDIID